MRLYKIGTWAFTRKWIVITGWLLALAVLGGLAAVFMKPPSSVIAIPGTQAQQTLERFNQLFPAAGAQSGRIVVATPQGKTIADYQAPITRLAKSVSAVPGVAAVVTPVDNPTAVSADKTIAYLTVQIKADGGLSPDAADSVQYSIDSARRDGLTVESGGDIISRTPGEILGIGEIGGVVLALVVLLITLGSLVAAGLPILIALITVAVSMAGLFALSRVIDINSTTPALAVMLGLAVGIDYSLFIINRYRTLLLEGSKPQVAAGRAVATAGSAVLFAAATVVIALAALAVVRIPFMTTMGLSAAATVAIAAAIAVTLIPALLGLAGQRVFGRRSRQRMESTAGHHGRVTTAAHGTFWRTWAEKLDRHRWPIGLMALALIVVMALPVRHISLGLPTDENAAPDSTQRKASDLLGRGFGAGYNAPLLVVVEGLPATSAADEAAVRQSIMQAYEQQVAQQTAAAQARFSQALAAATTPAARTAVQQQIAAAQEQAASRQAAGMAEVTKQVKQFAPYYQLNQVAARIAKVTDVRQATPILTTDNGTKGAIQVIPAGGQSDARTKQLVSYLRDPAHLRNLTQRDGTTVAVTGSTAVQLDINAKLSAALPVYLAVVVGLSLVLLIIAFRSILIPLKATVGFLFSVLAMFGALVAVFQWGWLGIADAPGPLTSFIPIISIGILFGLAMDYEFFLVSSMHEVHRMGKPAHESVISGFAVGSRVVVAAALIMVSVFAGFISNHDVTIQAIGFALALGILVDAFVVRLTLVPIVMLLLDRAAWWIPRWLEKRLPHVSVEGDR